MTSAPPTVAIVGRPNVGKSSLLNRLCRRRHALVDPTPGVTRDRVEAEVAWQRRTLRVFDTGGLTFEAKSSLEAAVRRQVQRAIEMADLIVFVCDVAAGILPLDEEIAGLLRKSGKPVLVAANKADTDSLAQRAVEFHAFGFGELVAVSSSHGRGIGELLDRIIERLSSDKAGVASAATPALSSSSAASAPLRLAIVGRPNVGKSTFLNRLVGEERVTVDSAPGTTRDAIESRIVRGERALGVIDTAGVRPRPKLKTLIDIVSVRRSFAAIDTADACLMVLDVAAGVLADDLTLLGQVVKRGRPCIIVLNKWDLIDAGNPEQFAARFLERAPFAKNLPVITTSTKTGYRVEQALALAAEVAERGRRTIPPEKLKHILHTLVESTDRPGRLRPLKLVRLRQFGQIPGELPRKPLTLELTVHGRVRLRKGDLAFVERMIREGTNLEGVPMRLVVRVV